MLKTHGLDVAVARHLQRQGLLVAGRGGQQPPGRVELALRGEAQFDVPAGDAALELVGGALGHDPAVVEQRDPVGELVRLLQLLGGEQDGDAAGGQVADDLPHGPPAARVQSGRGLVQEDQPRVADQGHGQVEPPPHPARVGAGQLAGGVGEVELAEQVGRPAPPLGAAQVMQVGHQEQVLGAGEQVVDGGELAGDADRGPDRVRRGGQVVAGHPQLAAVGFDQGGQDLDDGGLAGPVRAEEREDRALGDRQVDAVEHDLVAVGLAQSGDRDGQRGRGGGHDARRITMSP